MDLKIASRSQLAESIVLLPLLSACLLSSCYAKLPSDVCTEELALAANLLRNSEFSLADDGVPEQWSLTQHAGAAAYTVTFADGVMTVDKYGEQYWLLLSQSIDVTSLAGEALQFSAEIKLDMHAENWNDALLPGGGLALKVIGTSGDPFGRTRVVQDSMLAHEPRLGSTDWIRVAVPIKLVAEAAQLHAGFVHQAYGTLSVRAPRLVQVPASCGGG